MIAAIYARKSTAETGMNDEEKSVTRQIEHATAYAMKKGWTVSEDHIYSDDGISGAEFAKRPGFIRLMNALKPRPLFQVLIMSEESRLGRESIETSYALKQIMDAGVRVLFYLEDRERTLDNAMDKVMLSLANFASEMEREKASQRTHDAMLRKAKAGHVVGGRAYGYDNVDVYSPEEPGANGERRRSHVMRRVNFDEASVVRRIFEQYVSGGYGLRALAKELNAEGVLPPTKHRQGWAPSCIREILHRELYRGMVIWNKTQAIHRGGTQISRKRPQSEWLRFEVPELRIIDEALWKKVVARLEQTRSAYMRTFGNGRFLGHPSGVDLRSEYLLSGIAQCAVCTGSIVCQKRHPKQGRNVYVCAYHHERAKCTNDLRIRQELMDDAILKELNGRLDKRLIADAIQRALSELRSTQAMLPDQQHALERQLLGIEARLKHLVEAIATGKATEAVYNELQKEESVKKTLTVQLAGLDQVAKLDSFDGKRIERSLFDRADDMKALLGRHVSQTRQLLRKLIREDDMIVNNKRRRRPGRIICTPFQDARERGYVLTARASYAGLLGERVLVKDGGGGQPIQPSLVPLLRFEIQGFALVA